jgi:hypothetical protein
VPHIGREKTRGEPMMAKGIDDWKMNLSFFFCGNEDEFILLRSDQLEIGEPGPKVNSVARWRGSQRNVAGPS